MDELEAKRDQAFAEQREREREQARHRLGAEAFDRRGTAGVGLAILRLEETLHALLVEVRRGQAD